MPASESGGAALRQLFPPPQNRHLRRDPLGNLMMRYDVADSPSGLRDDLKKLLELSHIGERCPCRTHSPRRVGAFLLCFFVVVMGAYVRLSAAGLSCPDWPGCYGHVSPAGVAEAARPGRR